MGFIAGKYSLTLGGSTVGQISQGITISHQFSKQIIIGDNFAETAQDAVFRGANVFCAYTLLEWNAAAAREALWPYGSAYLTMSDVIGVLDSDQVSQIVMTALSGTPAASTPASITMPQAIIAEGQNVDVLFGPELRTVPIRQRVYPNTSGVFGTLT